MKVLYQRSLVVMYVETRSGFVVDIEVDPLGVSGVDMMADVQ